MLTTHRHTEAAGFVCENCGKETPFPLFCAGCGTSFPERRGLNLFARISVPRSFFLEADLLDRREVELSRLLHPDLFVGREGSLQDLSLSLQSALNEALAILRDPFARAEYLLRLEGGAEMLQNRSLPPLFLQEQMALREELHDGVTPARREEIRKEARRRLRAVEEEMGARFARREGGDGDPHLPEEIRTLLNQVKYLQNILRLCREAKDA